MFICESIVCGCFLHCEVVLSHFNRDQMAHKAFYYNSIDEPFQKNQWAPMTSSTEGSRPRNAVMEALRSLTWAVGGRMSRKK